MSSKTLIERRRKVYTALKPYLDEEHLLEAMWLWENKYSSKRVMEIRKYVTELVLEERSGNIKNDIYKSLTKVTYFPGEFNLLSDPYRDMQLYRKQCGDKFKYIGSVNVSVSIPPATVVFQSMIGSLLAQIKMADIVAYNKIVHQLKSNLPPSSLGPLNAVELQNWLEKKTDSLQLFYTEEFMSAFLTDNYVFLCEELGPISADQMMIQAVNDASKIKEAEIFNPKKLL
jgi:hypothetical protein